MGGAGADDGYSSDGLYPLNSRATIIKGGFRLNGNIVEIDITIRADTALYVNWGIIGGFPSPADTSTSRIISSTHNDLTMYYDKPPVSITSLMATASISSGTEKRFIGSYNWR